MTSRGRRFLTHHKALTGLKDPPSTYQQLLELLLIRSKKQSFFFLFDQVNAARMDFLYENRYDVSEETMSAAMQARLWPKNMVGVVEVATLKAIRERQQHEKFLRNRTEALRLALEEVTSQVC